VHLTGDPDLAADAAQEAFVRLLTRGPAPVTPDGDGVDRAERAWLFRVATRVALDERRTVARAGGCSRGPPRACRWATRHPTRTRPSRPRARHAHVAAALATLAVRDRTALLLREAGFPPPRDRRGARHDHASVGTVLARALTRLAAALRGAVPGGPEALR
jgi:DNA-directed RNA polymerase specialized sigma24 family protein